MRRRSIHFHVLNLLAALALSTVTSRHARADDHAVAEAQRRFTEGLDLADAGKHEEARLKFTQAAAVLKAPAVLFNLARAEQLTGHDLAAVEHFEEFVRASENDPKVTDALRDKAHQNIAALRAKLGAIELDAPEGSRVTVDGITAPDALRAPIALKPGRHLVEVTYEGRVKSVTVEAAAGTVVKARIGFDGPQEPAGTAPVTPPRADTTRWIVGGAIGAAGLAGMGLGVGFALASQGAKDDAEAIRRATPGLCAEPRTAACTTYDEKRSDVESAATVSTVGYVAGGVLVAGAVATVLLWPRPKQRSSSTAHAIAPWVDRDGAGAMVGGTF